MKDYQNLITIDIICHGVPSQKLLFDEISNQIYDFSEKYFSNPFAGYLLFGVILACAMAYIKGHAGK